LLEASGEPALPEQKMASKKDNNEIVKRLQQALQC
jgi:hypothetical protein